MIRHLWTIYCREVITDKDTGAISVLQLLDGILQFSVEGNSPDSDRVPIPFDSVLLSVWARSVWDMPTVSRIRIRMVAPDGDVLSSDVRKVDLAESPIHRLIGKSSMFVVKGSGVYEWVVERNADHDEEDGWIEQARIPVRVEINNATRA